jgi:predicted amidohydrolase YtcJ
VSVVCRYQTRDRQNSTADSVLVRDGRIAFVGRREQVNPEAGEEVVDLGGRVLLPGFVDSHAHLIGLARGMMSLDVTGVASIEEVARRVATAARERGRGAWIVGRGWDQSLWPGGGFPAHGPLTAAAPENPVSLTRVDGHASWLNAAAMQAAGITRETADPSGGRLLRDDGGDPTGVLIDLAQELVRSVIPEPGEAETDAAIERAVALCLSVGLVGVQEMGIGLETVAAYAAFEENIAGQRRTGQAGRSRRAGGRPVHLRRAGDRRDPGDGDDRRGRDRLPPVERGSAPHRPAVGAQDGNVVPHRGPRDTTLGEQPCPSSRFPDASAFITWKRAPDRRCSGCPGETTALR